MGDSILFCPITRFVLPGVFFRVVRRSVWFAVLFFIGFGRFAGCFFLLFFVLCESFLSSDFVIVLSIEVGVRSVFLRGLPCFPI